MDEQALRHISTLLVRADIEPTSLRLAVAWVLSREGQALCATDILRLVRTRLAANKVTLYRILDLFVDKGVAQRHSSGDRAFRYCLGPRFSKRAHCHAYCVRCGRMECLTATDKAVDVASLAQSLDMDIAGVEIRIDGVCAACRQSGLASLADGTPGTVDAGCGNP